MTDKASYHHDYLNFYEQFLSHLRHEPLKILEIGVLGGASLRTWEAYFTSAIIIGADINPSAKQYEKERVHIEIIDQSNLEHLTQLALKYGPFDLVIEDGSHMCEHQLTSLKTIFPFVKDNGIYIVEDLHTNYGSMLQEYIGISSITCVDYLKKWIDVKVGDAEINIELIEDPFLRTYGRSAEFMVFYRRACLIKKRLYVDKKKIPLDPLVMSSVETDILAHLSFLGDVVSKNYLKIESNVNEIQGISIDTQQSILQYKVLLDDGGWSAWAEEGTFLGSRGKSALLAGLAVRVKEIHKEKYKVRTTCRFRDEGELVRQIDGNECISPRGAPLCAVQIDLELAK